MTTTKMGRRGFSLLEELEREADSCWLKEHATDFEECVRQRFAEVLSTAGRALSARGEPLIGGKNTMFRQWRDRRFAPAGGEVRTWVEGVLARAGERIGARGAIAVRLDASGGDLTAGSFLLSAADRRALRMRMVESECDFFRILARLKAARIALTSEQSLECAPRGFASHAKAPLCLLYTSPSPRDQRGSRMPSSA